MLEAQRILQRCVDRQANSHQQNKQLAHAAPIIVAAKLHVSKRCTITSSQQPSAFVRENLPLANQGVAALGTALLAHPRQPTVMRLARGAHIIINHTDTKGTPPPLQPLQTVTQHTHTHAICNKVTATR